MSLSDILLRRLCMHPLPGWRVCGALASEGSSADAPRCAAHDARRDLAAIDADYEVIADRAGPGPVQELPAGLDAGELRSQPTEPQLKADSSPLAWRRAGSALASPGRKRPAKKTPPRR